jgi:uncharacterized protein
MRPGKAIFLIASFGMTVGCSRAVPVEEGPQFPRLTGRVVDEANLLPPRQEQELTARLEALEQQKGSQFVVVTVNSLQGYRIEDYGVRLGRHWGVGSKEKNDGALLIVAPNERKVRVEVGYGLEKNLPDHFAAKVLREVVVPDFREGAFPEA